MKKKVRRIKYKYKIYLLLFTIAFLMVFAFAVYNIMDFRQTARDQAISKADFTASSVVGQVDERLGNLWQYYISTVSEDSIMWMMEHTVSYSDYNQYHESQELLANKKLFGDYIDGYALVNFKTGWVLSSRGMFPVKEVINLDAVKELFYNRNELVDKNYWYYNFEHDNTKLISREWSRTIDTSDLNIVIKLPSNKVNVHGLLLVNLNMNLWQTWVDNVITDNEKLVVLDDVGDLIYTTDANFVKDCMAHLNDERFSFSKGSSKNEYAVSARTSSVLNWHYFVIENVNAESYILSRVNMAVIAVFILFIIAAFTLFANILYKPVGSLLEDVREQEDDTIGNEIDYIKDRIEGIKYDKQMLQQTVTGNRKKIQELFELRLIRGEVRSDDEWNEYFEGLHIEPCRYFAAAVMVLNLKGEFEAEDNISEDSVCLKLVEETPEDIKKLTWMPLVYNACTMFCIFGDDDENKMLDKIMEFYEGMQAFAESRFGFRILMGISATHTEHRHIYAAYRESINALTMRKETDSSDGGDDYSFYLSTMTGRQLNFNVSHEKDIQSAIKSVDKDQCYRVIDEFSLYLRTQTSMDDIVYLTTRMMNAILEAASNTNLELSKVFPDGLRKLYRDAVEVVEASRIRRYLKYALIDPILFARNEKLEIGSVALLEQIEGKILETGGNITLAECADALGVHQTYIWKILKMEKGKTFSEFVEEYKLEEAKRLLLDTNMSVNEIAEKLGYTNAQNFIRFFSKGTGLTPGKFRKLY